MQLMDIKHYDYSFLRELSQGNNIGHFSANFIRPEMLFFIWGPEDV